MSEIRIYNRQMSEKCFLTGASASVLASVAVLVHQSELEPSRMCRPRGNHFWPLRLGKIHLDSKHITIEEITRNLEIKKEEGF